jgi:hypothetical protein
MGCTLIIIPVRQHPSASVSIRQHTSAYVRKDLEDGMDAHNHIRTSAFISIRQHTSASVSIRQHTSEKTWRMGWTLIIISVRQHPSASVSIRQHTSAYVRIDLEDGMDAHNHIRPFFLYAPNEAFPPHTSAYVSIRQHASEYVSIGQQTSAYVSIRQHTSVYVSIRPHT